ncbi:MAG: hypothetical protein ACQEW8_07230 [Actinomycetota bacterium]
MAVATVVLAIASTVLRQVLYFAPMGAVFDAERVARAMLGEAIAVALCGLPAVAITLFSVRARVVSSGKDALKFGALGHLVLLPIALLLTVGWGVLGAVIWAVSLAVGGTLAFAVVLRVTDRGREQELIERKQVRRGP